MSTNTLIYVNPEALEKLALEQLAYLEARIEERRAAAVREVMSRRQGLIERLLWPMTEEVVRDLVMREKVDTSHSGVIWDLRAGWVTALDLRNLAQSALAAGVGVVPVTPEALGGLRARWKGPNE